MCGEEGDCDPVSEAMTTMNNHSCSQVVQEGPSQPIQELDGIQSTVLAPLSIIKASVEPTSFQRV